MALPDDSLQPINVAADSAKRMEKQGIMQYQGNVILQQGSLIVKADNIRISNNKAGDIVRISAKGKPVFFEQLPQLDQNKVTASAESMDYWISQDKVSLSGAASLQQGQSSLNSDVIVYMIKEQVFSAEKTSDNEASSRVHMVIPAPTNPQKSQ